ncbi:transcription antitermination regulator [Streptomyces fumigatiscleroticus]|nr:transcription antitermination regulator [Streptomyces fumigatiscleroticus]
MRGEEAGRRAGAPEPDGRPGAAAGTDPAGTPRRPAGPDNRRIARAPVSVAQGLLVERYRTESMQAAFELLRQTSQRFNVRLYVLVEALIRLPGPDHDAGRWFPRRIRTAPPPLHGLPVDPDGPCGQSEVLAAALHRVLHVNQTGMGNVQIAQHGLLRLEKHTGLTTEFTDYFMFVRDTTSACAQAARRRAQITVRDVALADVYDEPSRQTILRADSRACHSVPLVGPSGRVLGVISSHHRRPLPGPTYAQLAALQTMGVAVGGWLSWYRQTVVLDALEHLHAAATGAAPR